MISALVFVDMAPKISGTLYALNSMFYSAGGFAVPILGDALVSDYSDAESWRPLWLAVIVSCLLGILLVKSLSTFINIKSP